MENWITFLKLHLIWKGTIEEAIEAGEKMIAESNNNMQLEIVSPEKTILVVGKISPFAWL